MKTYKRAVIFQDGLRIGPIEGNDLFITVVDGVTMLYDYGYGNSKNQLLAVIHTGSVFLIEDDITAKGGDSVQGKPPYILTRGS